jgi:hypothetical protein
MAIYQTIIWECENCGKIEVTHNSLNINTEFIVSPSTGSEWAYIEIDSDSNKRKLICESCLKILTEVNNH